MDSSDVLALAKVTAVVLGGAGHLGYLLYMAVRSHRKSAIAVFSVYLALWVILGTHMYIVPFIVEYFPWSAQLGRRMAPLLRALRRCRRGVLWLLCVPIDRDSSGDDAAAGPLPRFVVPGETQGMDVLEREPPAVRRGAHADAINAIPAYEKRDEAQPDDGAPELCCVCLCKLVVGEMVKRLPACLHIFHQECIDRWLRYNSTCPVCRGNIFAKPPAQTA